MRHAFVPDLRNPILRAPKVAVGQIIVDSKVRETSREQDRMAFCRI